jgi:hypothetical protein
MIKEKIKIKIAELDYYYSAKKILIKMGIDTKKICNYIKSMTRQCRDLTNFSVNAEDASAALTKALLGGKER